MELITRSARLSWIALINRLISENLTGEAYTWITAQVSAIRQEERNKQLPIAFTRVHRYVSHSPIVVSTAEELEAADLLPGCRPGLWSVCTLCRIWLLLHVPPEPEQAYTGKILTLFVAAEMNELVALYTALPFLEYPRTWISSCEEGIRSNIGTVLDAIMYGNPYPAAFLPEASWNQLVLKAFFTHKAVQEITGLKERNNQGLQLALIDYAAERQAAGRTIPEEIYTLI